MPLELSEIHINTVNSLNTRAGLISPRDSIRVLNCVKMLPDSQKSPHENEPEYTLRRLNDRFYQAQGYIDIG